MTFNISSCPENIVVKSIYDEIIEVEHDFEFLSDFINVKLNFFVIRYTEKKKTKNNQDNFYCNTVDININVDGVVVMEKYYKLHLKDRNINKKCCYLVLCIFLSVINISKCTICGCKTILSCKYYCKWKEKEILFQTRKEGDIKILLIKLREFFL